MVKKIKSKQVSPPVGIAIGVLISVIITIIGGVLLASLIDAEKMVPEGLNIGVPAVHLIASFLGSWLAYLLTKQMRLIISSITAGGYMLVLCGLTALVFDGKYQGFWITALMVVAGMIIGIIPGIKGRKGHMKRHKIPAYR